MHCATVTVKDYEDTRKICCQGCKTRTSIGIEVKSQQRSKGKALVKIQKDLSEVVPQKLKQFVKNCDVRLIAFYWKSSYQLSLQNVWPILHLLLVVTRLLKSFLCCAGVHCICASAAAITITS
jgi:hypothetical protein